MLPPMLLPRLVHMRAAFHRQSEILARVNFTKCPQPNSPPDNVLRRSTKRSLGLKEGLPLPFTDRIPLSASVLSWLFDAGKLPKSRSQSAPADIGGPLATLMLKQPANSRRFELGPRAQPSEPILFRLRIHFADFPLPTLFHRPEAVHLGDLMRYEYDRDTRPPIFKGHGMHRHHATAVLFQPLDLPLSRFQGGQAVKQKR
ncbi:hypothetical protein Bca52824_074258 [Brassica carinata]|uniref:Uncharacterized protein n=1 Tax=Brassica carinata TaxID=52824 RepID=A0A8X7U6L8_BRACI|nr:hypothetical protein Bca52824_074258 [Brassica carinata]